MNDQELRSLVRDVVARRLADRATSATAPLADRSWRGPSVDAGHASHDVYVTLVNVGEMCLIEPDVTCNHCNYCKSHGH